MEWDERSLLEHTAWMRRLARGLTADPHAADDLVQDTWLQALRGGALVSRRGWLNTVLGRRASNERRARGRRADRERHAARRDGHPPADEALERVELSERLARAVFALDEPLKQVIVLRYFEELPPRRIASQLGLDPRAVESRLRRGLEALRKRLDAEHRGRREDWLAGMVAIGAGGAPAGKPLVAAAAALVLVGGAVASAVLWPTELAGPELRVAAAGEADLVAPAAGFVGEVDPQIDPPVQRRAVAAETLVLRLLREHDGAPVVGAEVGLTGWDDAWRTDADGVARLPWPLQGNSLRIMATETTRQRVVSIEGPGDQTVLLPRRGGTLRGRVVDLAGHAVPFAEVRLYEDRGSRGVAVDRPVHVTAADARGAFLLEDLASARGGRRNYVALAQGPGLFSATSTQGAISDEERETLLVVQAAERLKGHLSAWDRGRLPGTAFLAWSRGSEDRRVEDLRSQEGKRTRAKPWGRVFGVIKLELTTAQDGSFGRSLPATSWMVQVDHPEYATWYTEVEPGVPLDIVLAGGGRVDGVVLDRSGRPVEGALVRLVALERRDVVLTDAQGGFRFDALSQRDGALIAVSAEGHAGAVTSVDIGPGRTPVEVRLERELVVRGRLVDPDGSPVPRASVEAVGDRVVRSAWLPGHRGFRWEEHVPKPPRATTDVDGRFELRGLYPGQHWLSVGTGSRVDAFVAVPADGGPFEVVQGDVSGGVTLRCSAVLESGAIPERAYVRAYRFVEGEEQPSKDFASGSCEDGRFERAGLRPGRWRVEVWSGSRSFRTEVLDLGSGVHHVDAVLAEPRR